MTTPAHTACARNLPQHFNGCACTPTPGGLTAEVDIDLSEMGSSAADLLMEQIDAMRREAYEAGQRDAYAKMNAEAQEAQTVAPVDMLAEDMRAAVAQGAARICETCHGDGWGPEIGPAAGGGTLRSGCCEDCDGSGAVMNTPAKDETDDEAQTGPQPGESVLCGRCDGGGFEPGRDGYPCAACNGGGSQAVAGNDGVTCTFCNGGATVQDPCQVCGTSGRMVPTPPGQDKVFIPGYGEFHRLRDGVYPDAPYAMRFEANRPLSPVETQRLAQLIGYKYATIGRGEPMGHPTIDSEHSFVVDVDTTKGRTYGNLDSFEEGFNDFLCDGSPLRKSDRAGAGTKGTRLVEGMNDPDLKVEIYYDNVVEMDN